jgi:hypothetical protein
MATTDSQDPLTSISHSRRSGERPHLTLCDYFPRVVFRCSAAYSSWVSLVPLTGKWRYMSEKGQSRKSMFLALKNMEEMRRLYDRDTAVLAYDFKEADGRALDARAQSPPRATRRTDPGAAHRGNRETDDGCFPPSVAHGLHQIISTQRVLSEALLARWSNCLRRCAADYGRTARIISISSLPKTPWVFNASELLFAIVHRFAAAREDHRRLNWLLDQSSTR